VNSFIFFDSAGTLIVDATRGGKEAVEVAKLARKRGAAPKIILITHGHPDHYAGMAALKKEFPDSKIFAATRHVKDDIIESARFMNQGGWLDDEPLMKPKSEQNPGGFDYQGEIHVLAEPVLTLPGGEKIEVLTDFPPTEAAHETVLFSKDLNAIFASDLVYNGVHLWLGRGVDAKGIENWRAALKALKAKYAPLKTKVYPGHGKATDSGIFDTDANYMKDLLAIVKESKTPDEAKAAMARKYPSWENADFILAQSVKNQFALLKK
jgi:glyoxylase-like metal-dependent hydrolase (beta-lactamase superfamily II)